MMQHVWTITEAKARLSEVLRRAEEDGPQRIGARRGYIVMSEAEWLRLQSPRPRLGHWLVENLQQTGPLELPSRAEPARANPFDVDGAE
ncbi:type II toxin-antitoxin system prevent-host-death family antitoxin (plasmid) [Acuticoccus sp. MNP-M23]|uniref:type II toxin-antitoxin system prevent-host-death family antitoxin n=1 Tax=Acuticoccus sp. MNP-M23 TaxID=3072793 RepID=UPI0028152896|nr:type II toxin-antitoxin system prevent-host-death family antitoxin [Acuticoccus sp. MNP-M23]WMS45343.1 type II toxin-antitoxin system prevent-host-death family antitoxin [Acuticoccus sp. MNP-M23]